MSNYTVPAAHVIIGDRILVDGDSIVATVTNTLVDDTITTDGGRLVGLTVASPVTVVADDIEADIEAALDAEGYYTPVAPVETMTYTAVFPLVDRAVGFAARIAGRAAR
jgi:hypothetical protein